MSEDAIRSMFKVRPSHRIEPVRSGRQRLLPEHPYISLDYREVDGKGHVIHWYRYWETLTGSARGGECVDREGNILQRLVESRRSTSKME